MTFKHMKFEDSPTMRALEKVAKEKGLVKPEPLQKQAAVTKKADYTPSKNLMENIFKLCAGLRDSGLKKEADEIEMNYLNLKRAQTLYETSKETGEDLIQSAHPKGSHKLEGVDGDEAVVEDILDQHLKMVEKVTKKPTGKLSEAKSKDIINSVKRALGQPAPAAPKQETRAWTSSEMSQDWEKYPDKWKKYVNYQMEATMDAAHNQATSGQAEAHKFSEQGHLDMDVVGEIGTALQKSNNARSEMRNNKQVTVAGLSKMIEAFEEAKRLVQWQVQDAATKGKIDSYLQQAIGTANGLINTVRAWVADQSKLPPGITAPQMPVTQVATKGKWVNRLGSLVKDLDYAKQIMPTRVAKGKFSEQADGIITGYKTQITALQGRINSYDDDEVKAKSEAIEAKVAELEKWVNDFLGSWKLK